MIFRYLDVAEQELDEAVTWYESRAQGLGRRFLIEVSAARENIEAYPHGWHPLGGGIRRCRLHRFPYGLIYSVEPTEIVIIAVAHLHRKPDYWSDRLPSKP
jgi:toxin ParE2